jgi:hypothetical protein
MRRFAGFPIVVALGLAVLAMSPGPAQAAGHPAGDRVPRGGHRVPPPATGRAWPLPATPRQARGLAPLGGVQPTAVAQAQQAGAAARASPAGR